MQLFSQAYEVHKKHSSYCFLLGTSVHRAHQAYMVGGEREEAWGMQLLSCPKPAGSQLQASLVLPALCVCEGFEADCSHLRFYLYGKTILTWLFCGTDEQN